MNGKWIALLAGTVLAAPAALPATAAPVQGFTGAFAPAEWTLVRTGNLVGQAAGSATIDATTLSIVGGDDPTVDPNAGIPACTGAMTGFVGPCQVGLSIALTSPTRVSFGWTYTTTDEEGAGADLFGYLLDGVFQFLSDPGGTLTQSNTRTVTANSSLAFVINCTDCVGGGATAAVTNFQATAIPEPATIALFGLGAVTIAATTRRRRRERTTG